MIGAPAAVLNAVNDALAPRRDQLRPHAGAAVGRPRGAVRRGPRPGRHAVKDIST